MIKRNALILFSALILAASSCNKKESDPQLSISFTNYSTLGTYWVVLSDQTGNVLSWKALPAKSPVTLTFPQKDDSVNVTIINQSLIGNSYSLTTYANIGQGSYGQDPGAGTQPQTATGTFKLRIPNPTSYIGPIDVNSDCGWTSNADGSVYQINVCAKSSLYVPLTVQGTSTMRYLYIPQLTAGDSIVLDQTLFNSLPAMSANNIVLGEQATGTTILTGATSTGANFLASFWEPGYPEQPVPLLYPGQVGSLFNNYSAIVFYTRQSKPNVEFEFQQQTTSPGSCTFQEVQANLSATNSITTSNLSLSVSGSAHFIETTFQAYTNGSTPGGGWTVYSNFSSNQQVVLPQFPDDLKKVVDLSFISNLSVQDITLTQTSFGGYRSFCKNSIFANIAPASSSSKIYYANSNGQIGGRKAMMDRLARHGNYSIANRH